jgi:hypothetical protein
MWYNGEKKKNMKETPILQSDTQAPSPEMQKDITRSHVSVSKKSHEGLWGALLFAFMLLFVLVSVGGIGWVVYSQWKHERVAENRPSIAVLLDEVKEDAVNEELAQTAPSTESNAVAETETKKSEDMIVAAAKKLEISILNGGSPKGSAGVLAELLKKEGYLKTEAGSTLKDYTGVTLYYAANLEKEAEVIKVSVAKKYPQAKILLADKTNKETSTSQITIILGK